MDTMLITIAAVAVASAVTYGITAWAHRKGAPGAVVKLDSFITQGEAFVESAVKQAEPTVKAAVTKVETIVDEAVVDVEDAAWAALQVSIAKIADLSAKKQKVADANAEYEAAQKRVADLKASVTALPAV